MPTHFFHSGMTGAPTNTAAAGSTLEIIRSILVTGFNLRSVVSASVAGGVMTINYAAPHGYEDQVLIRLDGAPGGSIVRRVTTAAGASSLTIPAPGFADGAVAGSLSTRVAPADWDEVFTGAGKAVFRSKVEGPGSTRFYYRFIDTAAGGTPRMLRGFESMTDVDTGAGPFPTSAQETGGGAQIFRPFIGGVLPWAAVADGRTVFVSLALYGAGPFASIFFFGDEERIGSADAFCAAVGAGASQYSTSNYYRARNAAGTSGSQVAAGHVPMWRGSYQPYPAAVEIGGGLVLQRPVIGFDGPTTSAGIRSTMRGGLAPAANPIPSGSIFHVMTGVQGVQGRTIFLRCGGESFTSLLAFAADEDWA